MKKKLPLILGILCTWVFSQAQTVKPHSEVKPISQERRQVPPGPDDQSRAARYSGMFTRLLNLDEQQHEKVSQIITTRINAIAQLTNKSGVSDPISAEEEQIRSHFIQEMDNILTPEQKIKWDQYRTDTKQRKDNIRNGQKVPYVKSDNFRLQSPVLLKGDDGFDD
jgi:hypothetical protein